MTQSSTETETIEPIETGPGDSSGKRPCLTILYHPDTDRIGDLLILFEETHRDKVGLSRTEPPFAHVDGTGGAPLASPNLSRKPVWIAKAAGGGVILSPEAGGTEVRVGAGALHAPRELTAAELERGVPIELARRIVLLLHAVEPERKRVERLGFVGDSDAMERVRRAILQVAPKAAPVLLRGETGAGKELCARSIHEVSHRRGRPFVCVNLAAIPATTAASELFGHKAGAFTGATHDHRGYFEQADGGTLLLDEIGAIPLDVQSVLLRALESGDIQSVGARASRRIDVRVLAATDEDLQTLIAAGRFRAPLFHRISGYTVRVPPLRERRDDIGRLLVHFLRDELGKARAERRLAPPAGGKPPWLPASLVAHLARHDWPGNVRELHNVVRHIVAAYHDAEVVDTGRVVAELLGQETPVPGAPTVPPASGPRAEIDEDRLVTVMKKNRYRIGATAAELSISRNTLYALIDKSARLRKAKDLGPDEIREALRSCANDPEATAERLEVSARALKLRMKELDINRD